MDEDPGKLPFYEAIWHIIMPIQMACLETSLYLRYISTNLDVGWDSPLQRWKGMERGINNSISPLFKHIRGQHPIHSEIVYRFVLPVVAQESFFRSRLSLHSLWTASTSYIASFMVVTRGAGCVFNAALLFPYRQWPLIQLKLIGGRGNSAFAVDVEVSYFIASETQSKEHTQYQSQHQHTLSKRVLEEQKW